MSHQQLTLEGSRTSELRTRDPRRNEMQLYEILRTKNVAMTFHELQKVLNKSPGAIQATIQRALKKNAEFPIYESSILSSITNRKVRIFAVDPGLLPPPEPTFEELLLEHQKIIAGEIIEIRNDQILPFGLDRQTAQILQEIIKLSPNVNSLGQLFSNALTSYLKSEIPANIRQAAIKNIKSLNEVKK